MSRLRKNVVSCSNEIIDGMSAYKAFKPLNKRKMAEDYPHTAFPMLLELPQERFYPQAMCRAMDAIKHGVKREERQNCGKNASKEWSDPQTRR